MNKLIKILLAVIGATDIVVYMITPILLILFWSVLFGTNNFGFYLFFIAGIISVIFRAIKIGFLKGGNND